jgi:hypothetical protein
MDACAPRLMPDVKRHEQLSFCGRHFFNISSSSIVLTLGRKSWAGQAVFPRARILRVDGAMLLYVGVTQRSPSKL